MSTATTHQIPTGPVLTEELKGRIRALFPRYETKRAVLLPALHLVQEAHNEISDQACIEVANILELSPAAVLDVVTFYGYFWRHKRGRHHLTVCRSIACHVNGFPAVYKKLKETLGISDHETTADGQFSIHLDECLALCDQAPCALVNEKPVGPLTPERVESLIRELREAK
jgi:NADH-quinone oxidoreductase subunit E